MLVDGAVFTNFPSEQMKAFHRGVSAGSDVTRARGVNPDDFRDPPSFFGWVRHHGFNELPPIASLLMRSATAGVMVGQHQAFREAVDLLVLPDTETDLRQWKQFDETIESGRRAAEFAISGLSRDELDSFGI